VRSDPGVEAEVDGGEREEVSGSEGLQMLAVVEDAELIADVNLSVPRKLDTTSRLDDLA